MTMPSPITKPSTLFQRLFVMHPASVDETYLQHFGFALSFAFWLAVAAGAAFLHAVVPAVCEKTASQIVRRLFARIEYRGIPENE